MVRRASPGGILPLKGRISPFLVLLVVALALVGLVSFQTLKERKSTSALLQQSQSEVEKIESQLKEHVKEVQSKDETLKVVEEERDFLKMKLSELERQTESTQEDLKSTLRKKEKELQDIREDHRKALEQVEQLKGQLNQKEGEIVQVRAQFQEYAFAKARESAEQLNKDTKDTKAVEEKALKDKSEVEDIKLADEAGIDDRSKVQDEELQLKRESESLAVEKEMDERSKPIAVISEEKSGEDRDDLPTESDQELQIAEERRETQEKTEQDKIDIVAKDETNKDTLQDEETDEQEVADRRDETDEKETLETGKSSQDEEERQDLDTDLMTDLRSDHDDEGFLAINQHSEGKDLLVKVETVMKKAHELNGRGTYENRAEMLQLIVNSEPCRSQFVPSAAARLLHSASAQSEEFKRLPCCCS